MKGCTSMSTYPYANILEHYFSVLQVLYSADPCAIQVVVQRSHFRDGKVMAQRRYYWEAMMLPDLGILEFCVCCL